MSAAVLVLWVEQVKHQGKGGETCSLVGVVLVFWSLLGVLCFEDSTLDELKLIGPFLI